MLIAIIWTLGIFCVLFGVVWLSLNIFVRSIIEHEVRLMKQPGILGNEPTPEALERVYLSEGDLADSKRHRVYAVCLLISGILIIGSLLFFF
ncbi:MAG: hypothetical protein AAB365_04225 [Patescibacteria group bacterium]